MKGNKWMPTWTGVFIVILYIYGAGILISPDPGPVLRNVVWGFVPVAGVISTIVLLKESNPKGVYNSVLFALHLANVALATVMIVMLVVALPGIIGSSRR